MLVTTLGAQPQVVPIAVQLLQRQGIPIKTVEVIYTNPALPPIRSALGDLRRIFAAESQLPRLEEVQVAGDDVLTPAQMQLFEQTLFERLQGHVRRSRPVHLLLAGGRKSMAMIGVTVAQLLLGTEDRVWHLYSGEALRASGRWRLRPGDEAKLVPIPLPPPLIEPAFGPAAGAETPDEARRLLAQEVATRRQRFVEEVLTPTERTVALLAAREVLTVEEMAARLSKSPKTVTNQLTAIYSKLESHFGVRHDVGVRREMLRRVVGKME